MLNLDSCMPNSFDFSNATETPLFGYVLDEFAANAGTNSQDASSPRSFSVLPILNPAGGDLVLGMTKVGIE